MTRYCQIFPLQDIEKLNAKVHPIDNNIILTSEDGLSVNPQSLHTGWKRLPEKTQIRSIRIHDLRHLHISLHTQKGFDHGTIADKVGHTDPVFTLKHYWHMFAEYREAAALNLPDLPGSDMTPNQLN